MDDLVRISRLYGKDPEYVIAGGGNTSYKDDEKIWVKSSGSSMATISIEDFVCLDRKKLEMVSDKTYSEDSSLREQQVKADLHAAILYPKEKRPSVETSMHEIIQYPFVIHTHPTVVNGLLCAADSKSTVNKIFGDEVIYVEYTDPGYILFKAVDEAIQQFRSDKKREPKIIFLENHGVFVAADTTREVEELYRDILSKITSEIKVNPGTFGNKDNQNLSSLLDKISAYPELASFVIVPSEDKLADLYMSDKDSFSQIDKPFTPDNIVYCKSNFLFIADEANFESEFRTFKDNFGYYPKVVCIAGKAIFAIEENQKSAQIVLDVLGDIMMVSYLTQNFGGPRPMSQKHIEFIDNWEVENYRRKVSKES